MRGDWDLVRKNIGHTHHRECTLDLFEVDGREGRAMDTLFEFLLRIFTRRFFDTKNEHLSQLLRKR